MALNLNSESVNGSKRSKFGEKLAECETEEEIFELIDECRSDMHNDAEIFANSTKIPMEEVQSIIVQVIESDEVLPRDVLDFGLKNASKVNTSSTIDEFPEIEFKDSYTVGDIKAIFKFVYYGSQHRNNKAKAERKLALKKADFWAAFDGNTTLEDHLGLK